jgi:hypothetical protein
MSGSLSVLDPALVAKLKGMAESGMGFHVVDLLLRDGRIVRGAVVLNSEVLVLPAGAPNVASSNIVDVVMPP